MDDMNAETEALMFAREASATKTGALIRRRAGLSQQELARAAGVRLVTVKSYEQGRRRPSREAGIRYGELLLELVNRGRR